MSAAAPSPTQRRERRILIASGAYAIFVLLHLALEIAVAAQHESLLLQIAVDPRLARQVGNGLLAMLVGLLVFGGAVFGLNLRRQRRAPGRARLMTLGMAGVLHVLAALGIALVMSHPATTRLLKSGLGLTVPPELLPWLWTAYGVSIVSGLVLIASEIAAWLLLPMAVRRKIWVAIDVPLAIAAVWAIAALPAQPLPRVPSTLGLAVARHSITTVAALRLLARVVPYVLGAVEAFGFESLVAARHLRSKKSGFLAAISLLSVG